MRFRSLYFMLSFSLWFLLYLGLQIEYTPIIGYASTILLMGQSLWLIIRSYIAKNTLFLVFFGFVFLYTMPAKLFFFDGVFLSAHHQYYTYDTVASTTLIFALFLITINLFVRIPYLKDMKRIEFKSNPIIFVLLYIVAFAIVLTSKRSGSMYDGTGGEVEVSVLNEYVLILFLILYIYSGKKRYNLWLIGGLYTLYAIFALFTGGRIEIVLLLMLLLSVRFQYTISFKKIVILFVLGVWGMSMFGTVRQNPMLLLSGDVVSIINPFTPKEYRLNSQNSNEGDVYWASERMLILINERELTIADRIIAGISYFASAFVPVSWLSPLADLSTYKIDIEPSGGGGLSLIYFYVMFGIGGVILLGYFIAKMLNLLSEDTSTVKQFYAILMVTMLARWFAYNPIQLVKFCLWGTIAYYLTNSLSYTLRKHKR